MKYKIIKRSTIPISSLMALVFAMTAWADHLAVGDSVFEIDTDANLLATEVDHIDWSSVDPTDGEKRNKDAPSGSGDDSFGKGSKEDSPVPSAVTGSIPPNKSDLKTFGFYLEEDGLKRYLHLFWHRVQDPSGTTNMDFEFNQSETDSANGVTPVRTAGDALIQYDLANGGTQPELFLSRWIDETGDDHSGITRTSADCESSSQLPCWGARVNLNDQDYAVGSINSSFIPAAESDGLGDLDPRTFGEATIDFQALAGTTAGGCTSFGSAYLKSRSSDSFSSALKDFIAPIDTDIDNCATLKITKIDETDPGVPLAGAQFEVWKDNDSSDGDAPNYAVDGRAGSPDRVPDYTCTTDLTATSCRILSVLAGDYWVVEKVAPTGHGLATPAFQLKTINVGDDVVEAVFINPRKPAQVNISKTDDAEPAVALNGAVFTLFRDPGADGYDKDTDKESVGSCETGAGSNDDGKCSITGILPPDGTWPPESWYCLVETTTPPNYNTANPQCFKLGLDATKSVSFVNPRQRGAIKITKTRKHAADGAGDHPHAGVKFTITGGELDVAGVEVTTDANGEACVDNLVLTSFVGPYSVTETVPDNYVADGDTSKSVSVTQEATCGSGNEDSVAFSNTPLTDITVSVDSLVDGGTKSTIVCKQGETVVGSVATPTEDPTLSLSNKLPGTYVCTIVVDP